MTPLSPMAQVVYYDALAAHHRCDPPRHRPHCDRYSLAPAALASSGSGQRRALDLGIPHRIAELFSVGPRHVLSIGHLELDGYPRQPATRPPPPTTARAMRWTSGLVAQDGASAPGFTGRCPGPCCCCADRAQKISQWVVVLRWSESFTTEESFHVRSQSRVEQQGSLPRHHKAPTASGAAALGSSPEQGDHRSATAQAGPPQEAPLGRTPRWLAPWRVTRGADARSIAFGMGRPAARLWVPVPSITVNFDKREDVIHVWT